MQEAKGNDLLKKENPCLKDLTQAGAQPVASGVRNHHVL